MVKLDFNNAWKYRHLGAENEPFITVTLPHDAAISEKRSQNSNGGTNTGWFEEYDYEYVKTFDVPENYKDKVITFEFEGVYHNAEVYINGVKAAERHYGYTNFYVPANEFLKFGEQNEIRVIAHNADQPNSRWYSGAGIYRPVTMWVADKKHIEFNGVKIRTTSLDPATVQVTVTASEPGEVAVAISRNGKIIANDVKNTDDDRIAVFAFEIPDAELWSPDSPALYECTAIFGKDEYKQSFGIRTIRVTPSEGFVLNGERVIIRGACIHSDNGILGARNYPEAEARKVRILKEYGYNAIRSAHNPAAKSLLDECDKQGMLVMDEICVKLDPEKPVTTGVNIFFNYLYALGFGQYSDKKAEKNPNKKVGSEFFNNLAGLFGDKFMKTMATLPGCDRKTRDCYALMDVAGYNYGIKRYEHDIRKYPERIILGSETFCSDAYAFWEFAKANPALIGDFVWAGMDYLGEIGVGSWEYKEYAPSFSHGVGWISAGSGRIDLIGNPLGEALYTKVAFELEDKPQIAVVPVSHTDEKHSPSAWKFSNALPTWSWNGLNGKKAKVEVYSRAPIVELYINGKKVGKKKFKKNCRFDFKVKYYDGEITAVAKDDSGKELSRNSLKTAGDETLLSVVPEKLEVENGEVCFVRLKYTDKDGVVKPLERGIIDVSVEGGELLAVGNACPFYEIGYTSGKTDTYYGEAMAVVKAAGGDMFISASDGKYNGAAQITVK